MSVKEGRNAKCKIQNAESEEAKTNSGTQAASILIFAF
jgi:hypothetical protein